MGGIGHKKPIEAPKTRRLIECSPKTRLKNTTMAENNSSHSSIIQLFICCCGVADMGQNGGMNSSFIPVDAVMPGYSANQARIQKAQKDAIASAQTAERSAADATIDADAAEAEAAANRETSNRTNSLATMLAGQRRTPGGGIRMGGRGRTRLSASSVGGLGKANAQNMAAKKKTAAQAQLTSKYAQEVQAQNQAAMQQYANRKIGFHNGALYL